MSSDITLTCFPDTVLVSSFYFLFLSNQGDHYCQHQDMELLPLSIIPIAKHHMTTEMLRILQHLKVSFRGNNIAFSICATFLNRGKFLKKKPWKQILPLSMHLS